MNNEYNLTYIRWTARIFGAVLFFQIVAYAYYIIITGLGLDLSLTMLLSVFKGSAFLAVVLAGIVIAWKREDLGGILITAGLIGCYLLEYMYNPLGLLNLVYAFTFLPGILFMLYGFAAKQHRQAAVELELDNDELAIPEIGLKSTYPIAS